MPKDDPQPEPGPDQLPLWPDDEGSPSTSPPRSATRELLSPLELADRWGCSLGWLANLRCRGEGPVYLKLGSNVRYRMDDVRGYEAANAVSF